VAINNGTPPARANSAREASQQEARQLLQNAGLLSDQTVEPNLVRRTPPPRGRRERRGIAESKDAPP
jgi:hypothetical protein